MLHTVTTENLVARTVAFLGLNYNNRHVDEKDNWWIRVYENLYEKNSTLCLFPLPKTSNDGTFLISLISEPDYGDTMSGSK